MKSLLFSLFILNLSSAQAFECHPPSQAHLEIRLKESFHGDMAERELKEWMIHPSNSEVRKNIRDLDRRVKFTPQRLDREALIGEAQIKFEQAIQNTGRPNVMVDFPASGTQSKMSASRGALSIEMNHLAKEDLDVIPKEILDKIEPKVKINYYYPYDKFEYLLTYEGKEQTMANALLKVQKAMEENCERLMIENNEYRGWYERTRGIKASTGSGRGLGSGSGSGSGRSNQQ